MQQIVSAMYFKKRCESYKRKCHQSGNTLCFLQHYQSNPLSMKGAYQLTTQSKVNWKISSPQCSRIWKTTSNNTSCWILRSDNVQHYVCPQNFHIGREASMKIETASTVFIFENFCNQSCQQRGSNWQRRPELSTAGGNHWYSKPQCCSGSMAPDTCQVHSILESLQISGQKIIWYWSAVKIHLRMCCFT